MRPHPAQHEGRQEQKAVADRQDDPAQPVTKPRLDGEDRQVDDIDPPAAGPERCKEEPRHQARLRDEARQIGQGIDRGSDRAGDQLAVAQPQVEEQTQHHRRRDGRDHEGRGFPPVAQADAQDRTHGPAEGAVEHARCLAAAQFDLGNVIKHIGVEADKTDHRGHGDQQKPRHHRRTAALRGDQSTHRKHRSPCRIDPAARHEARDEGHHQPRDERDHSDPEIGLADRLRVAQPLVQGQRKDRDQDAPRDRLGSGKQSETAHARCGGVAKPLGYATLVHLGVLICIQSDAGCAEKISCLRPATRRFQTGFKPVGGVRALRCRSPRR